MSASLKQYIPEEQALLALEPERLAGYLLACLNAGRSDRIDPSEFAEGEAKLYGELGWVTRARAIAEAWQWLLRECLVASDPYYPVYPKKAVYFVTRKGELVKNPSDLDSYLHSTTLSVRSLHSTIKQKVLPMFHASQYTTAVFEAFKAVEIALRQAIGAKDDIYGVNLARSAFHPDTGKLSDKNKVSSEREADSSLFAGALGRYKNPSSHRDIIYTIDEASEAITLASRLLKIIDDRVANGSKSP